jgi:hypothetical protein
MTMPPFLQHRFRLGCLVLLAAALSIVLTAPAAHAQARSKRLVLKDGSYQAVTKYELKGTRVRYFSAERFEWEEMPGSLIDWPATEKYNASLAEPELLHSAREVDEEDRAERAASAAASPQVAPGLRLPFTGGVFLLDTYRGQPQLVELGQSGADVNKQTGKNILRAAINPLSNVRQSIELKGSHATVQAHTAQPVIFANVDQSSSAVTGSADASGAVTTGASTPRTGSKDLDQEPDRYRIVRMQAKPDMRVVGNIKIAMTGKVSQQQSFIKTTSQPVSGGWVKIVPGEDLTPGEYAVIEMLGAGEMNLYVWDFGLDPAAPQNSTAWKPVQPSPSRTGTDASPVLNKRPPK